MSTNPEQFISDYERLRRVISKGDVENRAGDTEILRLAREVSGYQFGSEEWIAFVGAMTELFREWNQLTRKESSRAADLLLRCGISLGHVYRLAQACIVKLDDPSQRADIYRILSHLGWRPDARFVNDNEVKLARPGAWFDVAWRSDKNLAIAQMPTLSRAPRFERQLIARSGQIAQDCVPAEIEMLASRCEALDMEAASKFLETACDERIICEVPVDFKNLLNSASEGIRFYESEAETPELAMA